MGHTSIPELNGRILGAIFMATGMTFVYFSHKKLGFYGTYMGDHFGIYLDGRITSFPFNVVENPMYIGSFLNMLGFGLMMGSVVVVFMSFWALMVYYSFISFHEEKFTANIYK